MGYPVVHWDSVGEGAEQVQPFYAELFGWKIDANNEYRYGMVDTGGGGINGGIAPGPEPLRTIIYVQVPDLQAALDRAEQLGGKTLMPPSRVGDDTEIALFADPRGNVVGLVKG